MKNLKKSPMAIAFLVIFMMSITSSFAAVPALISTEPSRLDTLWATGADDVPTHLNP